MCFLPRISRHKRPASEALKSHAVHCSPERAIGDGNSVVVMDVLPRLDYAGEENGGTNIRACKLLMVEGVSLPHETIVSGIHSISG
jgi:hypothetical protein